MTADGLVAVADGLVAEADDGTIALGPQPTNIVRATSPSRSLPPRRAGSTNESFTRHFLSMRTPRKRPL
jgi:hypothetical protein